MSCIVAGLASGVIGGASETGAEMAGMIGGFLSVMLPEFLTPHYALVFVLANNSVKMAEATAEDPKEVDVESILAAAKDYIVAILRSAGDQLERTLPDFFGDGNLQMLSKLYKSLEAGGLTKTSDKKSLVGRVYVYTSL